MRLFVAVELPAEVREHLDSHAGRLRDRMDGWRWVPSSQWHVTLAFLGEVVQERLAELERRMGLAARRHRPFDLEISGLGAFNSPRRARVLWAGIGGDRKPLTALADSVTAGARRARLDVEDRAYRPHVTLGRRRAPVDLSDALADGPGPGYASPPWRVAEFVLVQSHTGASVRHEIRARFPLRDTG